MLKKLFRSNVAVARGVFAAFTLVMLLALVFGSLTGCTSAPSATAQHVRAANVVIETDIALGSGVVVDAKGRLIMTARHVVSDAKTIIVTTIDGKVESAEVVYTSENLDAAILHIDGDFPLSEVYFDKAEPMVGDPVIVVGNPIGVQHVTTFGRVAREMDPDGDILVDATIAPGNSGGGVYSSNGGLLGVASYAIVWRQDYGAALTGVNGIVSIYAICKDMFEPAGYFTFYNAALFRKCSVPQLGR